MRDFVHSRGPRLFLAVLLHGKPYPEDGENRLRTRYAVLAGLNAAGYRPTDPAHLRYVIMAGGSDAQWLLPFERFEQSDLYPDRLGSAQGRLTAPKDKPRRIMVLWVDEEQLREHPLTRLKTIFEDLAARREQDSAQSKGNPSHGSAKVPCSNRSSNSASAKRHGGSTFPAIKILGPTDSKVLWDMEIELREGGDFGVLSSAVAYGPWATICGDVLEHLLASESQRKKAPTSRGSTRPASDKPPKIHRTIATDEKTCKALTHELALRRADPNDPKNRIALIAEWDTLYGQALPLTFASVVLQGRPGAAQKPLEDFLKKAHKAEGIHFFTYLRGIDGNVPAARPDDPNAPAQAGQDPMREGSQNQEGQVRPEGRPQLDYIRRLEQRLKDLEWELLQENKGRLRAIGVLGSDVYDKLLILRALRPSFPRAVFFTTDLDANLLLPKELSSTQNLIVASAFGLRLHPDLQLGIPPFRDSYQTSTYFATITALGYEIGEYAGSEDGNAPLPHVFERSRTRAYDLWLPTHGQTDPDTAFPFPPSARSQGFQKRRVCYAILALLLAGLLLVPILRPLRPTIRGEFKGRDLARILGRYLALAAIAIVMGLLIRSQHAAPDGEPFAWFQGISIWPTEILRVISMLLCVYFLVLIRRSLLASRSGITAEFFEGSESSSGGNPSTSASEQVRKVLDRIRETVASFWSSAIGQNLSSIRDLLKRSVTFLWRLPADTDDVQWLWNDYRRRRRPDYRVIRSLPYMLLFVAAGLCLQEALFEDSLGTISIARGRTAWLTYCYLGVGSFIALLVLIFIVLDVTLLCSRFIQLLVDTKHPLRWPESVRAYHAGMRGVDPEDVDEWLSLRLLARHTQTVGTTLYYPFVVLLIFWASRDPGFDGWDWTTTADLAICFILLVAIYSAVALRVSAKRAQQACMKQLRRKLTRAGGPGANPRAKGIELLLEDVKNKRTGALCPLPENPIIRAILIPSGGLGTLAIVDYLMASL